MADRFYQILRSTCVSLYRCCSSRVFQWVHDSVRMICDDILLRLPTLWQENGCAIYDGLHNIYACVVFFSFFEWGRGWLN